MKLNISKIFNRIVLGVLASSMIFSISLPTLADTKSVISIPANAYAQDTGIVFEENIIMPIYKSIQSIRRGIRISRGTAVINCVALGRKKDTELDITVSLQKYEGGSWNTIETFSNSGTKRVKVYEKYSLSDRGRYRIECVVTANGSESDTAYSYARY